MPKTKKNQSSLGKSLMNQRKKENVSKFHVAELNDNPGNKLKSIIDQNSLSEFLMEAEMSSKNFEAIRGTKIKEEHRIIDLNEVMGLKQKVLLNEKALRLSIPRRPKWDSKTTPEQLAQMENDSFLIWRRELAKLEEELLVDKAMTPFEKNLEVWKQLWRVIEKSDIIVQIVDGRNPLFFRCPDLEQYVKEIDPLKENILLINKSDLLSEDIRKCWSEYFNSKGINHIFFSALSEQEKIDTDKIEEEEKQSEPEELIENTPSVFNRKNLLTVLKRIVNKVKEHKHKHEEEPKEDNVSEKTHTKTDRTDKSNVVTIGMVGYPNVGKSSVINVLCKKKLVGVAAMPGKTKHFQTLFIEKDLMLCDCPGLVFPNFTSTRAEMVCNGVLPIDTIKDWLAPCQYLCMRVPKHVFEAIYKFHCEFPNPTASQVLQAFAKQRGFKTGRDLPDEAKVAKIILKDLVNGKVLCCALPPEYDKEKYPDIIPYNKIAPKSEHEKHTDPQEEVKAEEKKEDEELGDEDLVENKHHLDGEFFEEEVDPEAAFEGLDNDDILMLLLEGKSVGSYKLSKQQRRDIKFALKRGEKVDIKKLLIGKKKTTGAGTMGKFGTEDYVKLDTKFSALKTDTPSGEQKTE